MSVAFIELLAQKKEKKRTSICNQQLIEFKNKMHKIKKLLFMQHDFHDLTGSKKHGNPSEASFHELSVDAVHIGIRKAVLIISIADSVDPRHCRHVAEQQHPLKEWLLSLMTTYDRDQGKVCDLYNA